MFLFALACTAGSSSAEATDSSDSAAPEVFHPLVPEDQRYFWDTSGCDNNRPRTYIVGQAHSDASGGFTVTETHTSFYGEEDDDWEDDCVDVYSYAGAAMTRSQIDGVNASTYEEGYAVARAREEQGCEGGWGDGSGDYLFVFDTLTAAGTLNVDNAMLVVRFSKGWGAEDWKADTDYARGEFFPESDTVLGPPADYTWMGGGGCGW